jgi:hypothetical protein
MADDGVEAIGSCLGALVVGALIVAAVIIAVISLMSVGTVFGAGVGLHNYYQAFRRNVQPERATT